MSTQYIYIYMYTYKLYLQDIVKPKIRDVVAPFARSTPSVRYFKHPFGEVEFVLHQESFSCFF